MNDRIVALTGPQRVRLRPAVLFGSDGSDGVLCALEMVLSVLASECRNADASMLVYTDYMDGSVEIRNNGRGLYLGSGTPDDDQIWKDKLCEFYAAPADLGQSFRHHDFSYFDPSILIPAGEYECEPYADYNLCAVQYASAFMDVTVCRDGKEFRLHFEKGENVGGLAVRPSDAPSGTVIRFKLDTEVFQTLEIPADHMAQRLKDLAILMPSSRFVYQKETPSGMQVQEYCFPDGIRDHWVAQGATSEIYNAQISATGKDRYNRPEYGAKIFLSACFMKGSGQQKFFHNFQPLPHGGTHVERVLEEITCRLCWQLELELSREEVERHLCLMVHTTASKLGSAWISGSKTGIQNVMIADMAQDCINDQFSYYIKCHRREILEIFGIQA